MDVVQENGHSKQWEPEKIGQGSITFQLEFIS